MPRLSLLLPLDTDVAVTVARARAAEAAGLAGVWVPDHLSGGSFFTSGRWHGSLSTLALITAATNSLRLGTLVASAVMRPAPVLALELATLMAADRQIVAGIGTGAERDSRMTGVLRPDSRRLREYVATVRQSVPRVVVAANIEAAVEVAAEPGLSWVTTGGLRASPEAKLGAVRRLHRCWRDAGGDGDVHLLIDPHEPSPWRDVAAMAQALQLWGDEGVDEVVVWPAEVYAGPGGLSVEAASALQR